ncbi:MAG: hypothetical protein BRC29_03495 [Nanohaloarchaea archaeon SW_7_43_1]|nr:MAG: hypothetical protein BRC29_03495 [Nanohaloarchaea archaeon SW_7_43_1]
MSFSDLEKLQEEVEDCGTCCDDELCKKHLIKRTEIKKRDEMRSDPQRNRVGVRGDPTPDAEYGE